MHMIRLGIKTSSLFDNPHCIDLVQKMRSRGAEIDLGYLVHTRLTALFEKDGPHLFSVEYTGTSVPEYTTVLGYCEKSAEELRVDAQQYADPGVWATVDWEKCLSKPMPTEFHAGQRLGFSIRVCPVRRHPKTGQERDALFSALEQAGGKYVNRYAVYETWLTDRLSSFHGAPMARVINAQTTRFRLAQFFRQAQPDTTGNRKPTFFLHPDATIEGVIEIIDPAMFCVAFKHGFGRQKAFGFGMLLLRRP